MPVCVCVLSYGDAPVKRDDCMVPSEPQRSEVGVTLVSAWQRRWNPLVLRIKSQQGGDIRGLCLLPSPGGRRVRRGRRQEDTFD